MNEPRKSGHRLLDMVVGFSAMEHLVEVNSRPFIEFNSSNGTLGPNGEVTRELTVSISNPGSGSARIETFEMGLDGRVISDWGQAVKQLKQEAIDKHLISSDAVHAKASYSNIAPSYLKAGGDEVLLRLIPEDAANPLWDYVDGARRSGHHLQSLLLLDLRRMLAGEYRHFSPGASQKLHVTPTQQ